MCLKQHPSLPFSNLFLYSLPYTLPHINRISFYNSIWYLSHFVASYSYPHITLWSWMTFLQIQAWCLAPRNTTNTHSFPRPTFSHLCQQITKMTLFFKTSRISPSLLMRNPNHQQYMKQSNGHEIKFHHTWTLQYCNTFVAATNAAKLYTVMTKIP